VRYLIRVLLFTCCAAFLAACGGSSSGENIDPIAAPYTGTYELEYLTTTANNGGLDSDNCDPFRAELSYSFGHSLVKYQCGVYEDESYYFYIDSEDVSSWVSCEEPVFTVTGDYTAEISLTCTSIEEDIYYAEATIRKISNSFTVLPDIRYWEDPDVDR